MNRLVSFEGFEVDLQAGELRRNGKKIRLQQQPFRVLTLLLERRGELVTRNELRQAIWPDTFVEFNPALDEAIYKLRSALGDAAEQPRFVETLPRRGYRFIGGVDGSAPLAGELNQAPEAPARNARSRPWILIGGALFVGVALALVTNAGGLRDRLLDRSTRVPIHSLAVLPFANLSGDPGQEYFADGLTEALITSLGRIAGLRVISRTSAMHYKGSRESLPEIGRQLHVDAVVEGAVRRQGHRVQITAQLVEASTDRHFWAETYAGDTRDVLALEEDVARAITNEVDLGLSRGEPARGARARPVNPEAYDSYLKGRAQWNEWTQENLKRSIEYFARAIEQDPEYAPAWAGLADAHGLMALFGFVPPLVALPKAKTAALRAIELDETLSEAHCSLAGVRLHLEWSWTAAGAELRRALALNPNNALAHQWYGYYLSAMGQFDAAIGEMKHALELDPLSPNKRNSLAATLYRAGRYDDALQYFREVPDPDAISEFRHRRISAIYERKGMWTEAVAELLTALRLAGKAPIAVVVEQAYRTHGYRAAKQIYLWADVREIERRLRNPYPRPLAYEAADDYALLGEKDRAFEWLERSFREREGVLMWLMVDDRLEALRPDTRFRDLLRRTGLLTGALQASVPH